MRKSRLPGLVLIAGLIISLAFIAGCMPAGATPGGQQDAGSIVPLIIFMVLIFGMFYLLMIRPQRKRQREQQELLSQIKKGDKVITSGGIYGVIESTGEESVVIKVESGALLRVARSSIVGKRGG